MIIRNLKKHTAIPFALLSIVILSIVLLVIAGAHNNGTAELVDQQGDRSALDGIAIEGVIRDGYHEMAFRLEDGRVTKRTTLYDEVRFEGPFYSPGMPLPVDDRLYEIYPSFGSEMDYEIQYWNNRNGIRGSSGGTALVDSTLKYNGSGDGYTHTNYQEKGLAFIGERVFYAPPTTMDYSGKSGIYEVIGFSVRNNMQSPDREQPETKRIVELDLEGNSRNELKGLEILGLEAVNGKLALIALVDGQIVVKGYDADSGEPIGEVPLGEFVHTSPGASGYQQERETYAESYEAFADDNTGVLTLKFTSTRSTLEETRLKIASLSLQDGVTLVHEQKLSYSGTDGATSGVFNRFSFLNGKLFAIMVLRTQPDMNVLYDDLKKRTVIIEAYEAGRLAYRGEFVTDMNDDTVQDRYFGKLHGFQYEQYRYRQIGELNIRASDQRGGE